MTSNELEIFKQSILDEVRVMMQTTGQVTQYIGARYVPLIADPIEWSDQKEYEPLTIVTNQGNSYTSRQFVPKGTLITNEQFWAETGNFNAQIEQYRKEVAAFDARITAAQNAADSKAPINHATDSTEYGVGNAVNYGHVKLADADTPMVSGANDGAAATPKMVQDVLSLKRNRPTLALYIGNSYTDGVGSTDNRGIYELTKDMFDEAYKFTSGGAGFCKYTGQSGSKSFEDLINDASLSQNYTNADVTHIIFVGAWGETELMSKENWNGINNIKDKVEAVSALCKQKFPNVERMVYYWAESRLKPFTNNNLFWEFAVHNYAPYMFHSSEIEYIGWGGWDLLYNNTCFSADGYHPNNRGYNILANNFRTAFNGALTYQAISKTVENEPMDSIIEGSTMSYRVEITPDETRIELGKMNQTSVPASYNHFKKGAFFSIIGMNQDFGFAFPASPDQSTADIGHIVKYVSDYTYSDVQKTARINMLLKTKSNNTSSMILLFAYTNLSGTKSDNSFSSVTYFENPIVTIPFETIHGRV